MTKRLFTSISLPFQWRDAFDAYGRLHAARGARWTTKENIHITVCFLGDVDEVHIGEIKERIKKVCTHTEVFSLSFEKMSFAPPKISPRMVWAVFAESDAYRKLVESMHHELRSFLAVEPHEEKIPHATLARFKDPTLAREIDITKPMLELASFDVHSVELMESYLDTVGVRYAMLETFPLMKYV